MNPLFAMDSSDKSSYELQREQNILEIRKKLGFNYNPDAIATEQDANSSNESTIRRVSRKRKKDQDETYKGRINLQEQKQRRRSLRIAKIEPINDGELEDDDSLSDNDVNEDLESFVTKLQTEKRPFKKKTSNSSNYPTVGGYRVKEFSQDDIDNIAKFPRNKKRLHNSGTTCHQCRQCTTDTKSFCRNVQCTGINGQLCGPCLNGRYGEDLETTLKDSKWICPYCRGICNCSICRRRDGRLPTGMLSPFANKKGYASVHHLLNLGKNDGSSDEGEEKEVTPKKENNDEAESSRYKSNNEFQLEEESNNVNNNYTIGEVKNNEFKPNTKIDDVNKIDTIDETKNNKFQPYKESDLNQNHTADETESNKLHITQDSDNVNENDIIDETKNNEFEPSKESDEVNKDDITGDEAESNIFQMNNESDVNTIDEFKPNGINNETGNEGFELEIKNNDELAMDLKTKHLVDKIDDNYIPEVKIAELQEINSDDNTGQEDKENVNTYNFFENKEKLDGNSRPVLKIRDERKGVVKMKKTVLAPILKKNVIVTNVEENLVGFDSNLNPVTELNRRSAGD